MRSWITLSGLRLLMVLSVLIVLSACEQNKPQKWIPGWKLASEMTVARAGAALVRQHKFLYMIGGVDGRVFLDSVERARINADGSLGAWQVVSRMPEVRGFLSATIQNNRLYVVGGGNGPFGKNLLNTIASAPVNNAGEIGVWRTEKNAMLTPRRCVKTFVFNGQLFAVGGFNGALLDSVEVSTINSSGELGEWQMMTQTLITPRYVNQLKSINGQVFALGGHHANSGQGIKSVEYMDVSEGGSGQVWRESSPLLKGRYAFASVASDDKIFVLGGLSGAEYLNEVEFNDVDGLSNNKPWKKNTPLPTNMANFSAIKVDRKLFILGGSTRHEYLQKVWYAELNDNGQIGYWGDAAEYEKVKQFQTRQATVQLPNRGKVLSIIDSPDYTYLLVKTTDGQSWLAGSKNDYTINQSIRFSEGVLMTHFFSKSLNREFESILFVGTIELEK